MNSNLLIIGAGQYGLVAREIAQAMGRFDKIAFLDDSFKASVASSDERHCEEQSDEAIQIIGTTRDIEKFAAEFHYGFVAIGNPQIRRKLIEQLRYNCITLAILVHPTAYISPGAQLQKGVCIEPNATVQTGAVVASASFIASGAVIRHDSFVGEFCHIDCNAVVESRAIVPADTKVSCCSVFCQEQGVGLPGFNC